MNTDARRKASAAFHAKRTAEGYRKVTLWLHDDTREELARIAKASDCSKDRAAEMAINHYLAKPPQKAQEAPKATKVAPKPSKPAPEPAARASVPLYVPKAFNPQPKKR